MASKFSNFVSSKVSYYVYRLIDPRNGETFYVGKGIGNRVFSHAAGADVSDDGEDAVSAKLDRIRRIRNSGFEVAHVVHRHGLDEKTAFEVEAALMDAYPGITNLQGGHGSLERGVMHADEIVRLYEAPEATFEHDLILINVNKTVNDTDLLDAVRYAWKISIERARAAEYVLAVNRGLIVGAFVAEKWLPATPKNFPGFPSARGRYGFSGHNAPEDIVKLYIHKRVPEELRKKGAANPLRYVKYSSAA